MGFFALIAMWFALPLLFIFLFILPVKLMIRSLIDIVYIPRQIVGIAANARLRRNHALEHATINVLQQRYGVRRLAGLASEDGFLIRGWSDDRALSRAAGEALLRLQRGEHDLAVHRHCGTSQAVGNFLFAVLYLTVLLAGGRLQLGAVMLGGAALLLISPYLGMWIQRAFTTSIDVSDVMIIGTSPVFGRKGPAFPFSLLLGRVPEGYYVHTGSGAALHGSWIER